MNYRVAFFVCCALLLGSLLLNLPGYMQAQEVQTYKPLTGRYAVSTAGASGSVQVTVCDTLTGECWVRVTNDKWTKLGSPVEK